MSSDIDVHITEEGPREGFQFNKIVVPTAQKLAFINALRDAGLPRIQVASFVNPKRVPGWADADAVCDALASQHGIEYTGFWLNSRGIERAAAFSDRLTLFGTIRVPASTAFLEKNQRITYSENLVEQERQIECCLALGIPVTDIGIMAAFGCNYAGDIPETNLIRAIEDALSIADKYSLSPQTIRLADTMGWATPLQMRRVLQRLSHHFNRFELHLHLHNTRSMAIANAFVGLEEGVRSFDTSIAGVGGCPFSGSAEAAGNISTEDLVFLCEELGLRTGIDIDRIIDCAKFCASILPDLAQPSVRLAKSLKSVRVRNAFPTEN